jgi:hypothetical protein
MIRIEQKETRNKQKIQCYEYEKKIKTKQSRCYTKRRLDPHQLETNLAENGKYPSIENTFEVIL